MNEVTVAFAVANAEHYKAIGVEKISLANENDPDFPWTRVTNIEAGAAYRLSGPVSVRVTAEHECGLFFTMPIDLENRDADGKDATYLDRGKLRALALKLTGRVRLRFAGFLADDILVGLQQRTLVLRETLNAHQDSEDCVRGVIAFARSGEAAE